MRGRYSSFCASLTRDDDGLYSDDQGTELYGDWTTPASRASGTRQALYTFWTVEGEGHHAVSRPGGSGMKVNGTFTKIASTIAHAAGTPGAFIACCITIAIWALTGPLFGFSDTWQLIINTGTTIITFLMVFLIQNTQNRDGVALQAKLDELIRVTEASNKFIGIEHLTEKEVDGFRIQCERAAKRSTAVKTASAGIAGRSPARAGIG
jgi:low affinity Fe/Cu permease